MLSSLDSKRDSTLGSVLGPAVEPGMHHREARRALESLGWRWLASGDWSQVYASPDGEQVARITPFDPAYALHVRTCLAHPEVVWFQRIDEHCPLAPAGEIVVMERLESAEEAAASLFCCRLGEAKHLALEPSAEELEAWEGERRTDPALAELFTLLHETAAEGARSLGWFGGLDVRPGNVMQDGRGHLKLIDPYFVAGKDLIPAMLEDIELVARRYSREELEGFLEIAVFEAEEEEPGSVLLQLRDRVARLGEAEGGGPS
jgi:hypothetical protein